MTLTGPQNTAFQAGAVVLIMASLSFAAVPFYRWFCQVTGFAGTTNVVDAASDVILDQTIEIRFTCFLPRCSLKTIISPFSYSNVGNSQVVHRPLTLFGQEQGHPWHGSQLGICQRPASLMER